MSPISSRKDGGAREGPLFVPEELALQQAFRQGSAGYGDERRVHPGAFVVDRPCEKLLSRPALALDENRRAALRHGPRQVEDLQHLLVLADHVPQLVLLLELFPQKQVLLDELVMVHDLPDRQGDVVGVERLDEIVVGPLLHRLHGGVDRRVGRHDDDQHLGRRLVDFVHQLDSVHAGHLQIHQHQVPVSLGEAFQRLPAALHGLHVIPVLLEPAGQRRPDDFLVVHHHDVDFLLHRHPRLSVAVLDATTVSQPLQKSRPRVSTSTTVFERYITHALDGQ
jgi:hypothetical protein